MKQTKKRRTGLLAAAVFWLAVWQAAAMGIDAAYILPTPIQVIKKLWELRVTLVTVHLAAGTLMELLPQADFWQRVGFSAGHILLGFALGVVVSVLLAAAAERWTWVDTLLAPVIQLVKATPVASFIILALVWVSGRSLSILISFLMVLPVLYSAVRTGIESADVQLLEMAQVFHLPLARLAARYSAGFPAGVQRGAGHLLEEWCGRRGHRPARWQHRRCPLPGKDHTLYRGAVRLDVCHHPAERRL